jgi:UDPglucose--hexose-1-phosphate uridylyltransferase
VYTEDIVDWNDMPHRRFNPLTGETVLVSPHRTKRPWQGKVEAVTTAKLPPHDPNCYLCPGNTRAGGEHNPTYADVWAFTNDFSALLPDVERAERREGLFIAETESGICRVLCYSPQHNLTLSGMSDDGIVKVVDEWANQYTELGSRPDIGHVQIFENRGEVMGSSMPHPHGQIWAQRTVPDLPAREGEKQEAWRKEHSSVLLLDYLKQELGSRERIVFENDTWVALVPYWAVWPFETMLLPKTHRRDVVELTPAERRGLAEALGRMTRRYDNLFQVSFPYTMGLHQRPTDGRAHDGWQLHIHFLPPLLRSATVRKFMVGYELLAQAQRQRDITAEQAADRLRACSEEVLK